MCIARRYYFKVADELVLKMQFYMYTCMYVGQRKGDEKTPYLFVMPFINRRKLIVFEKFLIILYFHRRAK